MYLLDAVGAVRYVRINDLPAVRPAIQGVFGCYGRELGGTMYGHWRGQLLPRKGLLWRLAKYVAAARLVVLGSLVGGMAG